MKTDMHAKVDFHHRDCGTYIARYRIGNDRYYEGYGQTISRALEQLVAVLNNADEAQGKVVRTDE